MVLSPSVNKRFHYHNIDTLRGIAILAVLIVHCTLTVGIYAKYLDIVASFGSFGVDLFFVISGFLITCILLRSKDKVHYFKNFYVRRILRIFPLYYGFLIIFIIVAPIIFKAPKFYDYPLLRDNQAFYWLYISNFLFSFYPNKAVFFHLWSLSIEEQYYMIWPVFVRFINVKLLLKILLAIIVISFCLRCFFVINHYNKFFIWAFTPIRLEAISIGSLIAFVECNYVNLPSKKNLVNKLILVFSVCIVGMFLYLKGFYWTNPSVQTIGILLMDLLFGLIVLKLAGMKDLKDTVLNRIFKSLGKYCYAIYMFHELILGRVNAKIGSLYFPKMGLIEPYFKIIVIFLITSILSYLFALLSWNLYEKWFIKLKVKFAA